MYINTHALARFSLMNSCVLSMARARGALVRGDLGNPILEGLTQA